MFNLLIDKSLKNVVQISFLGAFHYQQSQRNGLVASLHVHATAGSIDVAHIVLYRIIFWAFCIGTS